MIIYFYERLKTNEGNQSVCSSYVLPEGERVPKFAGPEKALQGSTTNFTSDFC